MQGWLSIPFLPMEAFRPMPGAIGLFDSGRGGLSVAHAIRQALPSADLLYVADEAFAPYGNRSEGEILDRARHLARLLQRAGAAMLVVACNTATAVAVDALRREFAVPIVGVEPAVKPAVELTRSKTIAVLATARTLHCNRFKSLLARFARETKVLTSDCPGWVSLVEAGCHLSPENLDTLRRVTCPLIEQNADVLVLGCTHYPFLSPLLRPLLPEGVHLLNPAPAIARQVRTLARQFDLPLSRGATLRCYATNQ